MALHISMRLADSFRFKKPHHHTTGRQRQDASGATLRGSSVSLGASSSDLSEGGRSERERKFALYRARNLIERFFSNIKQFDGIATWAKLTCRSSVGRCYHLTRNRSRGPDCVPYQSLTHGRTLLDLRMIDSFGNVLSEDIKWKRARWIASLFSLSPVRQVQIDSRTWLVLANMIVSSALGALHRAFAMVPASIPEATRVSMSA